MLFDDLNWKFSENQALKDSEFVKMMPEEEKQLAQLERVFTLLASQHPNFSNHKIVNRWAWTQKVSSSKLDKDQN